MTRSSGWSLAALLAAGLGSACRPAERRVEAPPPAPTPVSTPALPASEPTSRELALEPMWTPEPIAENRAATPVEPPAPRPTVDVATIPNFDRPRDPTPGRAEQLAQCLTFSVENLSQPGYSGNPRTRVRVRARNSCSFWIPSEESWFEVVSSGAVSGGVIGREVGRFQAAIAPYSTGNETMLEIDCPSNLPGGCRLTASVPGR